MLLDDFAPIIGNAKRVLVLWDAHGFEIAGLMLGHVLPLLADREHMILMHDISDLRFADKLLDYAAGAEIWQGMNWVYNNNHYESRVYLGWIDTIVDQAIAVVDFLTRHHAELGSADKSFHEEIGDNPAKMSEMKSTLLERDLGLIGHWAYFSLNSLQRPYTFPTFKRPQPVVVVVAREGIVQTPASVPVQEQLAKDSQLVQDTKAVDLIRIVLRRIIHRISGNMQSRSTQ